MIMSRCIHVATNDIISFFLTTERYFSVCVYCIFFIQSSVDGHLDCVHVLAVVNNIMNNLQVVNFQRCKHGFACPITSGMTIGVHVPF